MSTNHAVLKTVFVSDAKQLAITNNTNSISLQDEVCVNNIVSDGCDYDYGDDDSSKSNNNNSDDDHDPPSVNKKVSDGYDDRATNLMTSIMHRTIIRINFGYDSRQSNVSPFDK